MTGNADQRARTPQEEARDNRRRVRVPPTSHRLDLMERDLKHVSGRLDQSIAQTDRQFQALSDRLDRADRLASESRRDVRDSLDNFGKKLDTVSNDIRELYGRWWRMSLKAIGLLVLALSALSGIAYFAGSIIAQLKSAGLAI